jgi:hypothetical protein
VEGNNRFQVAWLPDDKRDQYLQSVQAVAQKHSYQPRRPQIVFEGNAPAQVENNRVLHDLLAASTWPAPSRRVSAWLGEPTAIREPVAAHFRRQSASNLLIVGQNDEAALGMMAVTLIGLATQHSPLPASGKAQGATFYILDFGSTDAPHADFFTEITAHLPHSITVGQRRQLPDIIRDVASEMQRRLDADEGSAPPIYLFIYGLQRARDLRQNEGMGYSIPVSDESVAASPSQQLTTLIREGPDVGIHALIWCDNWNNLNRTLDRRSLREFEMRVVFQMSAEDSANLVDSAAASKLGPYRALFYSEEDGRLEKFRPYSPPSEEWLEWAQTCLRAKSSPSAT